MSEPILALRGVNKIFGPVHVLHDVDFTVRAGEVTALVGDNGAGKSTLVKCIAGIHPCDTGEVLFNGKPVHIHGPRDAADLGIEVVYQDLALADNLDIVQNMFLGRERGSFLDARRGRAWSRRAPRTLASLSVRTVKSVRTPVSSLSGGQRQTVAIAKSVLWNSKVVLLDEPTAALGVAQTRQVLDLVRRLAEQGLGVVLISHNMNDVLRGRRPDRGALPRPDGRRGAHQGRHPQPGRRADHRGSFRRPRPGPTRRRRHVSARGQPDDGTVPLTEHDRTPTADTVAADARTPDAAITDFGIDTTSEVTRRSASRDYFARLRGGELGALPAAARPARAGDPVRQRCRTTSSPSTTSPTCSPQGAGADDHRDGHRVRAAARRDRPVRGYRLRCRRVGARAALRATTATCWAPWATRVFYAFIVGLRGRRRARRAAADLARRGRRRCSAPR